MGIWYVLSAPNSLSSVEIIMVVAELKYYFKLIIYDPFGSVKDWPFLLSHSIQSFQMTSFYQFPENQVNDLSSSTLDPSDVEPCTSLAPSDISFTFQDLNHISLFSKSIKIPYSFDKNSSATTLLSIPSSESSLPTTPSCSICGDRAGHHLHYGAVACFSCRQFFRRGKARQKQCISSSGGCNINKYNRTNCKHCR